MNPQELSQLSDEELLKAAKANKPSPKMDAFFIGLLVGIILYSIFSNGLGIVILIPLFLVYLFLKKPKQHAALKDELKKRGLG